MSQINRAQVHHQSVRKAATDYILANEPLFQEFFPQEPHAEEVEGGFKSWIARMCLEGTYGDDRTLRAVAHALKLEIHVHQHPEPFIQIHPPAEGEQKQAEIHLYYIPNRLHYQTLIPKAANI